MQRKRQRVLAAATVTVGLLVAAPTSRAAPFAHHSRQSASIQCPAALPPDAGAAQEVASAVQAELLSGYPPTANAQELQGFRIVAAGSLAAGIQPAGVQTFFDTPYRGIAAHACGNTVADRSWVVFVFFPKLGWSADMSQGVDYVARTATGWHVWWRYH